MFPRLYANYWLSNDDQKGKIESDDKGDARGDDYTIKSLPLPQLLSLLTETKAPFFYGDDERLEPFVNPNHSLPLKNQNLHDNFMWSKFIKDATSDGTSDEEAKLNDALLELFRWSIQPPHPAIYEDSKNQSGYDILLVRASLKISSNCSNQMKIYMTLIKFQMHH